ncbi:hypothetical protein H6A17_13910, partial [Mordavella massiliensis]|nr:hypothetical protein [Mordavella massiliensis]
MDSVGVLGEKIVKTLVKEGPVNVAKKTVSYLKTERAKKLYVGKEFK